MPLRRDSPRTCGREWRVAVVVCGAYLNSVIPLCLFHEGAAKGPIYLEADQTLLRKPSRCVSLFIESSDSPMARTKPDRA